MCDLIPLHILKQYCSSDPETVAKLTDEWLEVKNNADRRAGEDAAMANLFVESAVPTVVCQVTIEPTSETLKAITDAHIESIVRSSKTLEEAAKRLDINPATLYRRKMNMKREPKTI